MLCRIPFVDSFTFVIDFLNQTGMLTRYVNPRVLIGDDQITNILPSPESAKLRFVGGQPARMFHGESWSPLRAQYSVFSLPVEFQIIRVNGNV